MNRAQQILIHEGMVNGQFTCLSGKAGSHLSPLKNKMKTDEPITTNFDV